MRITLRTCPPLLPDVLAKVDRDVRAAIGSVRTVGDEFVVNDTPWFGPDGKPIVMNQAEYISRRFQAVLRDDRHWSIDPELEGERIDGYTVAASTGDTAIVRQKLTGKLFSRLLADRFASDIDQAFSSIYQRHIKRRMFTTDALPEDYRDLATTCTVENQPVRIGLEFETGNIASSSRALAKLDVLYRLDLIDAGVFITCLDKKNAAARIWPSSNRNSSLQELDAHNYWKNIIVPLWVYGFRPDRFDPEARYLCRDGSLYAPVDTGRTKRIGGQAFRVYIRFSRKRIFRPSDV